MQRALDSSVDGLIIEGTKTALPNPNIPFYQALREKNIPVVFKTELSNGRIACAVAESTGAKVLAFTSCHNLTKDEFQSGATYISLMEGNLQNLREALN